MRCSMCTCPRGHSESRTLRLQDPSQKLFMGFIPSGRKGLLNRTRRLRSGRRRRVLGVHRQTHARNARCPSVLTGGGEVREEDLAARTTRSAREQQCTPSPSGGCVSTGRCGKGWVLLGPLSLALAGELLPSACLSSLCCGDRERRRSVYWQEKNSQLIGHWTKEVPGQMPLLSDSLWRGGRVGGRGFGFLRVCMCSRRVYSRLFMLCPAGFVACPSAGRVSSLPRGCGTWPGVLVWPMDLDGGNRVEAFNVFCGVAWPFGLL